MIKKRLYETTFIVNAALEDQDIDAVVSKVTAFLTSHGADITSVERWGRKRLAYPINKKFNGYYVHCIYEFLPSNMGILDRFLVLEDTVLRYLTLHLSEEMIQLRKDVAMGLLDEETEEESKKDNKKDN
jgi:small subunit ribosomal protein S6